MVDSHILRQGRIQKLSFRAPSLTDYLSFTYFLQSVPTKEAAGSPSFLGAVGSGYGWGVEVLILFPKKICTDQADILSVLFIFPNCLQR